MCVCGGAERSITPGIVVGEVFGGLLRPGKAAHGFPGPQKAARGLRKALPVSAKKRTSDHLQDTPQERSGYLAPGGYYKTLAPGARSLSSATGLCITDFYSSGSFTITIR